MKYRNTRGSYINPNVKITHRSLHEFISSYNHIYISGEVKQRLEPLRRRLGIGDIRKYLVMACELRRCVIVLRDDITLIVVCNRVRYTVDYETLRILDAEERYGDTL